LYCSAKGSGPKTLVSKIEMLPAKKIRGTAIMETITKIFRLTFFKPKVVKLACLCLAKKRVIAKTMVSVIGADMSAMGKVKSEVFTFIIHNNNSKMIEPKKIPPIRAR